MQASGKTVTTQQAIEIAKAHYQMRRFAEAEAICRQILSVEPKNGEALHLMGVVFCENGNNKQAVKYITQAIKINKNVPDYYHNLGLALQNQGELQKALLQYRMAITLKPTLTVSHMNMANILQSQGKLEEALAHYQKAIDADPGFALAHYNLGNVYANSGRYDESIKPYERAIALKPDLAEAYTNLGVALKEKGRLAESIALHQRAIALKPDLPIAYNNLGTSLQAQDRYAEAEAMYTKAISLQPVNPDAWFNLAFALQMDRKLAESITAAEQAVAVAPDSQSALTTLIHQRQHACSWDGLAAHEQKLLAMIRQGRNGISPFSALCLPSVTARDQLICARGYSKKYIVAPEFRFTHAPGAPRAKLRLGYLSADYHQHPTAYLMAELIERHDREKFEVAGYSYGPDDGGEMRQRLVKAFDKFVDVRALSHPDAAKKIHDDGVDILIDLKGYTGDARIQIASYRPAPIQVNYLGYPGTMGTDFMDYIIADPFVAPFDQQPFFSEQIVQLPDCYQPNDTHRRIAEPAPTRALCGLPEQGFVFCSFNSAYKITPDVFTVWMNLLKAVPGSVLWLFEANQLVRQNLNREAQARGVDPARMVFAPPLPLPEHLARHRLADLFLDNLPVNAHTGASDALWAGLPLVTCAGQSFVSRVAGSLLTAAGVPELITYNLQDYEALALGLAQNPDRLKSVRDKIVRTRAQMPLFDIQKYVGNLEKAYRAMWKTWEAGEAPRQFRVSP